MKNSNYVLALILLALAGFLAWHFFLRTDAEAVEQKSIQFAVEDMSKVHRILVADRRGKVPVVLTRRSNGWVLNDSLVARKTSTELVLDLLERVRVRNRPPKNMKKFATKSLIDNQIRVQVVDKEGRSLTDFSLGGTTQDQMGTFMIKDGSNEIFVGHIPGFSGNIRERLDKPSIDDWRDKSIFDLDPANIESLRVEFPLRKAKSYLLRRQGDAFNLTLLYPLPDQKAELPVYSLNAEAYLQVYDRVGVEDYINNSPYRNAIEQMTAFCQIDVSMKNGQTHSATFYPKLSYDDETQQFYVPESTQAYQRYWIKKGKKDLMLAQTHQVQKLFIDYAELVAIK